jgi:hypothetical protein
MFKNYFKLIPLLLLPLLTAVLVSFTQPAFAQANITQAYIVQLNNSESALLESVGHDIKPAFNFVQSQKFENIYTFQSELPLSELQIRLAGKFTYLEEDKQVSIGQNEITRLPNDPGVTTNASNIDKQWGLVKTGFTRAWRTTTGSPDVVVAVIDTGIDATHEDFRNTTFVGGYDVITNNAIRARANSDDNGHGTLIAGVIAATANNGIGIAGASYNVSLMAVKALNARGSGTSSRISQAIVWAADNGADVINLSLGGIGFGHDTTLANSITYAFEKNVVIVAAAGNDVAITGGNLDIEPVFPICNDNGLNMVIGVTASDVNDLKPNFANFGRACVDVTAPGRRILSTINHDPATGSYAPDSYAYASGTSLATPHVSAQAALLKSLYPFASNRQIRDRIISTADQIDRLNLIQCSDGPCIGLLGSGRINVPASLEQKIPRLGDGDIVQLINTTEIYLINGGRRQRISPFVRSQRYFDRTPSLVYFSEIQNFPEGSFAPPLDGTLIKSPDSPTVFYMSGGIRLPITRSVFEMRNMSTRDVVILSSSEVNSWVVGSFLTPPEGSLVRTPQNQTVYWVVNGMLHPINFEFYNQRGLNIFPVTYIPEGDIDGFPKGESYVL